MRIVPRLCVCCLFLTCLPRAFPQTSAAPVVMGTVNAASYSAPIKPGSVIAIFGSNLATATQSAPSSGASLPTLLGGTSVAINGTPAPLFFVSSDQINAQLPVSINSTSLSLSSASLIVNTPVGASQPLTISIFAVGPGFFTADSSGCGQAVALNVLLNGTLSLNSTVNSAAPGDYVTLFGTGLGTLQKQPSDGSAVSAADPFTASNTLYLDGPPLENAFSVLPTYSGAAPTLVGVDQINFQIPQGVRNGCAVPVSLAADNILLTPFVTLSINANHGQCSDPPSQSYGEVRLNKTIASGTTSDGTTEQFSATFPSGPGLKQPQAPVLTPGANSINVFAPAANLRGCSIAGYTPLSAGTIQIKTPTQGTIAVVPTTQAGWISYQQKLPAGSITPGQYTIVTQAGDPVTFNEVLSVGTPITIQTNLTPGTILSAANPPVITWTGGGTSEIIRATLIADASRIASPTDIYYASASAGSLTLQSSCVGQNSSRLCTFGLPPSNNAELRIDVLPASGIGDSISAEGISQKVRFTWNYEYVFGKLSVTN